MDQIFDGLKSGLVVTVVAIFLLLAANYQSWKLAFVVVSTVPAVLAGVVAMLFFTRTTLNIQSFMGGIMSVGVAVANSILLITFAERFRKEGMTSEQAAVEGARSRLRPILMTSFAMIAGMIPMAIGASEGGEQAAPLGRAVIGGLVGSTAATLLVLPTIFAMVQRKASSSSPSLDPDDQKSVHYAPTTETPHEGGRRTCLRRFCCRSTAPRRRSRRSSGPGSTPARTRPRWCFSQVLHAEYPSRAGLSAPAARKRARTSRGSSGS
jgi:predicted RND superfamily exporter protein